MRAQLPILETKPAGERDPVCGMTVDAAKAKGSAEYKNKMYYFCCSGCETTFKADPEKYLNANAPEPMSHGLVTLGSAAKPVSVPTGAPAGTRYVCPMDPEVVSARPGACPK